jgi:hypothetical protein
VLDLDLKVATAGVGLDQEWVGTQSGSRKGVGRGQATQGEGVVLLPAWLRHCGTVSAGTEQVLTKETGAGGKNG